MNKTLRDRPLDDILISILDDYAEYVLWQKLGGDMFSGAINQEESINEILTHFKSVIEKSKPEKQWMIDTDSNGQDYIRFFDGREAIREPRQVVAHLYLALDEYEQALKESIGVSDE